MQRVAYALPIQPGKEDTLRDMLAKMAGDHAEEHGARRFEQGIRRILVFEQHAPSPMMVLYMETVDHPGSHFETMHAGEDEFQELLARSMTEMSGVDFKEITASGPPVKLLFDWHPEHGHSLAGHPH